jgi:hypothetical protein
MKKHLIILPYKAAIAAFIFSFILISCDKKGDPVTEPPPLQVEETAIVNPGARPVITIAANAPVPPTTTKYNFVFDWEHAQNMPVMPGKPAVPVPWSDQAIKNYDRGLQNDFKKSDGWEMVYNNFSDSLNFDNRVFILYNKFRGVLRYYTYNATPSNPSVADYRWFINELGIRGAVATSPIFNYADQLIVDMNANSRNVSVIEPWPISERGWYISQFELAYDKNMINYNWEQFSFGWTLEFAKVEELSINNKLAGNKMIYLQKPGLRFTSTTGVAIGSNMQAHVKSVSGLDEFYGLFPGSTMNKLKQTIFDSAAGNKLNATLVPSLNIADCKLDVSASIRLGYNLVGYVGELALAPPGLNNSKVIGMGPLFNEPMGIFYLGAQPIIHHVKADGALPEQYTLDVGSVEYIINPYIQTYAEVRNFQQEIVAVEAKETTNLTEAKLYQGQQLKASAPLNVLGVRVSFEVVPKNGTAPIRIIKTFKANVQTP